MKIAVVATLFYSEDYIAEFYNRMMPELKKISSDYEIILVNDGSPDKAAEKVLELQQTDPNISLIDLSRNFGHHKAIMTGLRFSEADYTFLIDIDLEEDPELLSVFWQHLQEEPGTDVIYGIQKKRKGNWAERITGHIYYKVFAFISGYDYPANTLTARLMSKRYLEGLKKFSEKEMDIWGLFILNGFRQKGIFVQKKHKGTTTYTFRRKIKMAIDSVTSLSGRPLYLIFLAGLLVTTFSLINVLFLGYHKLVHDIEIEGLTSILVSIWLIGGIIMLSLGVISIYLSKIFLEIKNRPLSIIKNIYRKNEPRDERN